MCGGIDDLNRFYIGTFVSAGEVDYQWFQTSKKRDSAQTARLLADCMFLTFKKHCRYDNIYLLLHSNELFKKNLENSLIDGRKK